MKTLVQVAIANGQGEGTAFALFCVFAPVAFHRINFFHENGALALCSCAKPKYQKAAYDLPFLE